MFFMYVFLNVCKLKWSYIGSHGWPPLVKAMNKNQVFWNCRAGFRSKVGGCIVVWSFPSDKKMTAAFSCWKIDDTNRHKLCQNSPAVQKGKHNSAQRHIKSWSNNLMPNIWVNPEMFICCNKMPINIKYMCINYAGSWFNTQFWAQAILYFFWCSVECFFFFKV